MYDVMAVAGAVWSYPYAWKGPALVTLGREINENKWLGEQIGAERKGFVTPPCHPLTSQTAFAGPWPFFWLGNFDSCVLFDDN